MEDSPIDLVVVGAGWFGLAAAKTYIELHPGENVILIEAAPTVGGVWAPHRHYPGLKSNNLLGMYEYSDFPMDEKTFGVKPGQHIPASVLHQYLTTYAKYFGVFERIRFNTKVENVEVGQNGGWILKVQAKNDESDVFAKKLILATGLTSEAYIPNITGSETFNAPLFHTRQFAEYADTLKTAKNVVVLGGAKSAWDAAYAYATAGAQVDMIIRTQGHGPGWMAPSHVTPLKKWLEKLVHTRFLTWFSPCIWGPEDGYVGIRKFFHTTFIGRAIVNTFWKILSKDVIDLNGFDKDPALKNLKPWNSAFWMGSGLGVLNYPTDFFELVRNGSIRVHIADVTHLSENTVHLSTGESLPADILLCATGWKAHPHMKFVGISDEELGLPYSRNTMTSERKEMEEKADAEILKRFPRLKDQPKLRTPNDSGNPDLTDQPFRLYRFMIPPLTSETRTIAFAGMLTTITTAISAQTQALWISTYFDGNLDRLPEKQEMEWETLLHSQYGKWRYPCGLGARLPDFVFDALPYLDMLLRDLGLDGRRKGGGIGEIFRAYGPEDYKGLVEEWSEKHKKRV